MNGSGAAISLAILKVTLLDPQRSGSEPAIHVEHEEPRYEDDRSAPQCSRPRNVSEHHEAVSRCPEHGRVFEGSDEARFGVFVSRREKHHGDGNRRSEEPQPDEVGGRG